LKLLLAVTAILLFSTGCKESLSGSIGINSGSGSSPSSSSVIIDDQEYYDSLTSSDLIVWNSASDPDSDISYYELSVGSTIGGTDVKDWTNIGNVTSYQVTGLSLSSGTIYYISLRAVDESGNKSDAVNSDGWLAGGYCSNKTSWTTYNQSGNAGTLADPHLLCTAEQLADLAANTSAYTDSFKLMEDIDLAPYYAAPNAEFQIGVCDPGGCNASDGASVFTGNFDGNNFTISNFSLLTPTQTGVGLFATVNGSEIKNLRLEDAVVSGDSNIGLLVGVGVEVKISNITASGYFTIDGSNAGGIIGYLFRGKVFNSSFTANGTSWATGGGSNIGGITGHGEFSAINNSSATLLLAGAGGSNYLGGIVGSASYLTISTSHADFNVTNGNNIGGIVGYGSRYTIVSNSYSNGALNGGNFIGGIFGRGQDTMVTRSFSTVDIFSYGAVVGGIIGESNNVTLLDNFFVGAIVANSSATDVGIIAGNSTTPIYSNNYFWAGLGCDANNDSTPGDCNTTGGSTQPNITDFHLATTAPINAWDIEGDSVGYDEVWAISGTDYPTLWHEDGYIYTAPFSGRGTAGDPYQITSIADFTSISQNPRYMNSHFILTSDLNFTGTTVNPIGGLQSPFSGVFNGDNKTLSNLTMNLPAEQLVAPIGVISGTAFIKNLNITNINTTGVSYVSGVVGIAIGSEIEDVHVSSGSATGSSDMVAGIAAISGYTNISRSSSSINVSGADNVGGIAGIMEDGSLVTHTVCSGDVSGNSNVGGIVGMAITSSYVVISYATGDVTGTSVQVGGIAGYLYTAGVTSTYSTGTVSGTGYLGGLVGYALGATVNANFSVSAVNGTLGTAQVGPVIGVDVGSTLGSNHYWSGQTCDSTGAAGVCNSIGTSNASNTDFYVSSNSPLSAWDFTNDWTALPSGYPVLQ
tara:strand:+ start:186218 stop:188974 length:2757 start_codon:yes stop_codon:yes gene_type:complete